MKYYEVIAKYPYSKGNYLIDKEDFFENLILYCIEADHTASDKKFYSTALHIVDEALYKQRQEFNKLYNPHRNLYLDKCYGESLIPLGEWMDFSEDTR